jgi:hypothetical protein
MQQENKIKIAFFRHLDSLNAFKINELDQGTEIIIIQCMSQKINDLNFPICLKYLVVDYYIKEDEYEILFPKIPFGCQIISIPYSKQVMPSNSRGEYFSHNFSDFKDLCNLIRSSDCIRLTYFSIDQRVEKIYLNLTKTKTEIITQYFRKINGKILANPKIK